MTLAITPGTITPYEYYRFDDATLADIVASMGTMSEVGEARYDFAMSFDHANGVITRVELTMRLRIGMPVWSNRGKAPKKEQAEWDRFHSALRAHEDGHIAIYRREAPTTYQRLLHAKPDTIDDRLEKEQNRINALSDAYDTRTDHGRTQQTAHGTTVITVPP